MTATRDRRTAETVQRESARKRDIARDIAAARPFQVPSCGRCGVRLWDSKGNPRWEVTFDVVLVCLGGCR